MPMQICLPVHYVTGVLNGGHLCRKLFNADKTGDESRSFIQTVIALCKSHVRFGIRHCTVFTHKHAR